MNKDINYLLEYLIKIDDNDNTELYKFITNFFNEHYIYTPSKYELKTLGVLANRSGFSLPESFEQAVKELDKCLEVEINGEIKEAKIQLLTTILLTNFPKNQKHLKKSMKKFEEKLEKVDKKIYRAITSYIYALTRGLELFYVYTLHDKKDPELYIDFSNRLHIELIELIFNEKEKELLADKLKEIMSVYLCVYARYLYM